MVIDNTLAYSVGVFDGEGCIAIGIAGTKKDEKYIYFTGLVQLSITNTNKQLLEKVKDILLFPNKIYSQQRNPSMHSILYQIIAQKPSDILKIIALIEPLSLCTEELKLAREACEYILNIRKRHYYWDYQELDSFDRKYVQEGRKMKGYSANRGRHRKYNWRKMLTLPAYN